jgi:hypothetical protein
VAEVVWKAYASDGGHEDVDVPARHA